MELNRKLAKSWEAYKAHKGALLSFAFVYTIMISVLTTAFSFQVLEMLTVFWLMLILLAPISISFGVAAMRIYKQVSLRGSDVYNGFRGFVPSITVEFRIFLKPLLISILIFLVTLSGLFIIYFNIWQSDFLHELSLKITAEGSLNENVINYAENFLNANANIILPAYNVIILGAFGISFCVFSVLKAKKMMALFICLNSPMNTKGAQKFVNDTTIFSKELHLYNLIFVLYFVVVFIIAVGFYLLTMHINYTLFMCLACMILVSLYSLIIPLKYLFYGAIYQDIFKKVVDIINEKYFEMKAADGKGKIDNGNDKE